MRAAVECLTSKVRYETPQAARRSLRLMRRSGRHRPEQGPLRPYWCEVHQGWHLGHDRVEVEVREREDRWSEVR